MLLISEVMITNPEMSSFEDLVLALKVIATVLDERFFQIDVKPDYGDTPENWEDYLGAVFY